MGIIEAFLVYSGKKICGALVLCGARKRWNKVLNFKAIELFPGKTFNTKIILSIYCF